MKVGDLVRYRDPIPSLPQWIGVVAAVEIVGGLVWTEVHWHDGVKRWEYNHNLEKVNEGG
jgi:hypothetical protein